MLIFNETQNPPFVGGEPVPCLRDEAGDGFTACAACLHEAGQSKLAQMP